eukprot:TRINITY_DN14332_c0_g1_i2.p1 TRINITY_DN14332_c0_g1~~TRINITY_DN14332_c0_g1_i2.p1  ORF type:complete len:365 (-),score=72.68 TRINITY_DN14332_c0_g1_i2:107-1201(-)
MPSLVGSEMCIRDRASSLLHSKQQTTQSTSNQKKEDEILDDDFIKTMLVVEQKYQIMTKHEKIRIEQWTEKLCQVTSNIIWKKNRNQYAKQLLENVLHNKLELPFSKMPPEGPLPKFDKIDILTQRNNETKPVAQSKIEKLEEIKRRTYQMSPRSIITKSPPRVGTQSPLSSTQQKQMNIFQQPVQKNIINQYIQQSPLSRSLQKNKQQLEQTKVDVYKVQTLQNDIKQTNQEPTQAGYLEYHEQNKKIENLSLLYSNSQQELKQLQQLLIQAKQYLIEFNKTNSQNQYEVDLFIQKIGQEIQVSEKSELNNTLQKQQQIEIKCKTETQNAGQNAQVLKTHPDIPDEFPQSCLLYTSPSPRDQA